MWKIPKGQKVLLQEEYEAVEDGEYADGDLVTVRHKDGYTVAFYASYIMLGLNPGEEE
jgi:hypothetical protein